MTAAEKVASAVQDALTRKLKSLEVDGGTALFISEEDEAELQAIVQGAADLLYPGRFKVSCASQDGKMEIRMRDTYSRGLS